MAPPPEYSSSTELVSIFCNSARMYCLPVRPMVTTRMTEAVPMTMPSAVRAKRSLLELKLSSASLRISLRTMVRRALSSVCWKALWRSRSACSFGFIRSLTALPAYSERLAVPKPGAWRSCQGRRLAGWHTTDSIQERHPVRPKASRRTWGCPILAASLFLRLGLVSKANGICLCFVELAPLFLPGARLGVPGHPPGRGRVPQMLE